MNVTASLLALLVGLVIPAVVALITKQHLSDGLKALVTAAAAALTGGLSGAVASTPHGWQAWQAILWPILLAWIGAAVTWLTGYSPISVKWIAERTSRFGIGPAPPGP